MPLAHTRAALSLTTESALLAAPSQDACLRNARVSCKHVRDGHNVRTHKWKLESTYVPGQCEYVFAQSTEMCYIAACTNYESWNLVDCRASDVVFLRKSSHKGTRQSQKLESLLDDEQSLNEGPKRAALLANKTDLSIFLAAPSLTRLKAAGDIPRLK